MPAGNRKGRNQCGLPGRRALQRSLTDLAHHLCLELTVILRLTPERVLKSVLLAAIPGYN